MSIELKNVTYTYSPGTAYESHALKDVSLVIPDGQFIGIIGHTGSGKSTLIQHLNALVQPTSGQVLYNGEDVWAEKYDRKQLRSEVGLVFQYPEHQLFENDVISDVCFGPMNQGLSREEAEKVMKLFLEQEPDLRVVFAESDEMALGAIDAIEKSGKTCGEDGDIIVISFGGSKAGIEAVKEGKLNVTFECNPGQGPKAAELIQRLESDISIDKEQYVEETYFDGTMDLDEIIENRTY